MSFNAGFNFVMLFGRVIGKSFKAGQEWREKREANKVITHIPLEAAARFMALRTYGSDIVAFRGYAQRNAHHDIPDYLRPYILIAIQSNKATTDFIPPDAKEKHIEKLSAHFKRELIDFIN